MGATGGGMVSLMELCREASPAAEGGRAGKKRREKGRKVCIFYMLTFSSFFVHLYKHKKGWFFCAYLYVYIKKKKCICKIVYRKQSWRYTCICLCMYFKKVQRLV